MSAEAERLVDELWRCCHDTVARTTARAALLAYIGRLEEALRDLYGYIEDGTLVRDTSRDGEPHWAIRMGRFVLALRAAKDLIDRSEDDGGGGGRVSG